MEKQRTLVLEDFLNVQNAKATDSQESPDVLSPTDFTLPADYVWSPPPAPDGW